MRYNPCFVMAVLVTILGQVAGADAQTPEAKKPPVIAVVDFQYITQNSLAGKTVRKQVNAQHQIFQNEIAMLQSVRFVGPTTTDCQFPLSTLNCDNQL